MRHIGTALHILAAASTVAAIWSPIGTWWQWLASAVLLLLAGAMVHGSRQIVADQVTDGADLIRRDITAANERKTALDQPVSADGRYDADGNPASADVAYRQMGEDQRAERQATLRRTYGKQANQ